MHSMIQTVHRNGHSDFFASDEWRGGESITVKDHTKLPGKVFSKRARSATRSAAKYESGGSDFSDNGG